MPSTPPSLCRWFSLPRSHAHEQLDEIDQPGAGLDVDTLRGNLHDIARYNALFGSNRLLMESVHRSLYAGRVSSQPGMSFIGLDVGMGAGDFVQRISRQDHVRWIGLDTSLAVLHQAGSPTPQCPHVNAIGQALPFADASVDVVTCAQTLHHLEPNAAVQLLRECARVARRGVVVHDLARSRLTLAGVWLLTRLTSQNSMTHSDGVLSARRAYTTHEAAALALQAGWPREQLCMRRHGPFWYSLLWRKH
jgi:SAM-dependent methyltransferase